MENMGMSNKRAASVEASVQSERFPNKRHQTVESVDFTKIEIGDPFNEIPSTSKKTHAPKNTPRRSWPKCLQETHTGAIEVRIHTDRGLPNKPYKRSVEEK